MAIDPTSEYVIILGAGGQVGQALGTLLTAHQLPHLPLPRSHCDITNPDDLWRALRHARFVVNCAAFTAVDKAESEMAEAYRINEEGASNVAQACAAAKIPLLHLSTDYVFDGASTAAYRETDVARPVNVYGQSKYAGELAIQRCHSQHIILRTSWIFSEYGQNFVKTILRLASRQSTLRIVTDQIGGPTAADDIAAAILKVIGHSLKTSFKHWGTYHFTGAPPASWWEFARAIVSGRDLSIVPITTEDFPTAARRPAHSVLDCQHIHRVFDIEQPDWRTALTRTLGRLLTTTRPMQP